MSKTRAAKQAKKSNEVALTALDFVMSIPEIAEAFTRAEVELAIDDKGWGVGGIDPTSYDTPETRRNIVRKARMYWVRDPLAKQAVRVWNDYAIGSGVTYKCASDSDQQTLDAFFKDANNKCYTNSDGQQVLSRKTLIDGDLFLAFYGTSYMRTVDPLQMQLISNPDDDDEVYAFKRTNAKGKVSYLANWSADDPNAGTDPDTGKPYKCQKGVKVYHKAHDRIGQRGNSLLSAAIDWTRENRRFMEARVAICQSLAKFAWSADVKGGQSTVDAIKARLQSSFAAVGTANGQERNPPPAAGASWIANEGANLKPMPRVTGGSEAQADSNNLKLMVAAATGIMLHYFGDPSTGNLATATAMELPMLKQFQAYQEAWKDTWRDLMSIVLEEDPDGEKADIEVKMPNILAPDLAALGAAITTITTVFPEAKVPEILAECIKALGIDDVDGLMEAIAKNKVVMDAKAKADALLASKTQVATAKAGAPMVVTGATPPPAAPPTQESVDALTRAVQALQEALAR